MNETVSRREAVKRLTSAGAAFALEGRYRRHDGEYRWLRSVSQPRFGPDGELIGFIGVASDITLAKEAELDLMRQVAERTAQLASYEEQLRQSQKMEALGQLTGGIAHDFNNLLTVVVGGLDIIAKRTEEEKLKRYADNALAAAERGARLTGQLLAFSRVQRLEVRPTHVAPLIQNMRPLLRNVLGPGIAKQFDLDEEMFPVMADPTQLEVAVLNLAINARDAMPDGGMLSFATRKVEASGDPELDDGDYIELTISDTGTGMAEDVAARAFEPFFTTKEVGKGTGLGLSMVYGMARQSGGAARIESVPGEGTAVKIYFRAAPADAARDSEAPRAEAAEAAANRLPASVLVIDDDPDVRGFIAASLEENGYRVRQASDGRSGLVGAAGGAGPSSAATTVSSSCDGLTGLGSTAATPWGGSARAPSEVTMTMAGEGPSGSRERIPADSRAPSPSGSSMSRTYRSKRTPSSSPRSVSAAVPDVLTSNPQRPR